MKKVSVDVLNEADRQQRIMDWVLFATEQDARLWSTQPYPDENAKYKIGHWTPGDPIYRRPNHYFREEQCIRQMIEEIPDGFYNSLEYIAGGFHCDDCDVFWDDANKPCWFCGKEIPPYPRAIRSFLEHTLYDEPVTRPNRTPDFNASMRRISSAYVDRMRDALRQTNERLRGLRAQVDELDESNQDEMLRQSRRARQLHYELERERLERLISEQGYQEGNEPEHWTIPEQLRNPNPPIPIPPFIPVDFEGETVIAFDAVEPSEQVAFELRVRPRFRLSPEQRRQLRRSLMEPVEPLSVEELRDERQVPPWRRPEIRDYPTSEPPWRRRRPRE